MNCAAIKQQTRIEDIIGQVVPLTRHGHWLQGSCPFHADRHPSLVVWPRTGTWKCMTCSPVRDDVIGFVVRWKQCSTPEALRWLQQEHPGMPSIPTPIRSQSATIADVPTRDATYQALLGHWGLASHHRAALKMRGLSEAAITQAGLASVIPGHTLIAPRAAGIPGFARTGHAWRIVGPAGIAIPVRDEAGRIQAVHIRADDEAHGKYRWLSTPHHPGGAASGAPIHVVRGVDDVVWITEGPLKAIIAGARLGHTVLGVPGFTQDHGITDIIAALAPRQIVLALDIDPHPDTAARVWAHSLRLAQTLRCAGWPVVRAQWEGPKGLDEALVAGERLTFSAL